MSTVQQQAAEVVMNWTWEHSGFDGCAFRAHSRGLDANTRYGIAAALAAAGLLADPTTSRTDAEQAVIDAAIAETKAEDETADEWSVAVTSARTARRAAVDRLTATEETT